MAISGGDGSIILTTAVEMSGLKKGLAFMKSGTKKAFAAIGVASVAATVAITKMATSAYADYEQMVGGIEALWGKSAKKIIDYANDAFYTASQSANDYMRQVTLFSVALIRSTAGDTEKAADIANMAMIDIADNVARLGTDIKYVELAYQGFARNQYLLLDNLRIGYGGTREEMKRLLRDAEAITGVKYDISNLSDVYTAIHVIQEELGIAGSAALEAEKTITGSARMMKAAWQNTLAAIAGGGDLNKAINNLVYSITKYFENIVPVVERALVGIGQLIGKIAPLLIQRITAAVTKAIPNLINAVFQMVIGSAKGLYEGIEAIFSGKQTSSAMTTTLSNIQSSIGGATDGMNDLGDATEDAGEKAKKALAGFDDLNILKDNSSSGDADLSSSLGNVVGVSAPIESVMPTFEETEPPQYIVVFLEKLKELLTPTRNLITDCVDATKKWAKKIDFSPLLTSLTKLWEEFDTINSELHLDLGALYTEILLPLGQWATESFLPVFIDMISESLRSMSSAFGPVREGLTLFFEKIRPVTDFIGNTVVGIFGFFRDIFKEVADVISEKGNKITEIFAGIGDIVSAVWTVIDPILSEVWRVVEELFTFIAEIVGTVIGLVIDVLAGVIEFLAGVFTGDWERAWNGISGIFTGIWDAIVGILSGFWEFLKGVFEPIVTWIDENIIQPIENFFSTLWDNIKIGAKNFANFFIRIINGLIGGFESFVNFFVDAINGIIEALNKLSFTVPDWVPEIGGKQFGFNISKVSKVTLGRIPELATGTVVPPNKKFMAVLGDNTKEHEIVSPLSTMKQAFMEAMIEMGGNFGGGNTEVVLEIDGREFGRAVVEQGNRENRRIGTKLVIA